MQIVSGDITRDITGEIVYLKAYKQMVGEVTGHSDQPVTDRPYTALKPGDVYGRVYGYPRAVRQHAGSENARLYLRALFVQY